MTKKERFRYFLAFFQHQIREKNVKQKDVARFCGRDATYVNKLYKGRLGGCPDTLQEKIADFFGIKIEELLQAGRNLYEKGENIAGSVEERRSLDPKNLKNSLIFVGQGIDQLNANIKNLKETLEIRNLIFSKLQEGVTFFNTDRQMIFSSNRWRLLDNLNANNNGEENISVEAVALATMPLIENFEEVQEKLFSVFNKRESGKVVVVLKTKQKFLFSCEPIYDDENKFRGMLLINTPLK